MKCWATPPPPPSNQPATFAQALPHSDSPIVYLIKWLLYDG